MNYNKSLFEGVPRKQQNKSRFNRSHEWKANINPGYIVPMLVEETMPGDEYTINTEFMFRFDPLYFPIMHKLTMRADYFYIPNRILWPNINAANNGGWVHWITNESEEDHPTVVCDMLYFTADWNSHTAAYMGLPLIEAAELIQTTIPNVNAFPLSAYLKIWDEYYRVPQLEEERWFPLAAGDNTAAMTDAYLPGGDNYYPVLSSKWEKDYFTSALPTPQIGEAVQIPMISDDGVFPKRTLIRNADTGAIEPSVPSMGTDINGNLIDDGVQELYVDNTNIAATIKQLRLAETLQSYYERIMKVGQKYRDFMIGLYEKDPTPMAVDVPVLIGSKFGRVQIADVMTQANTDLGAGDSRTGDYTGQANLYSSDNDELRYHCLEHGWIIGLLQVNANTGYGQGIERFWRRSVPTDYPLDMFAGIGDQEILKEEILWNPVTLLSALNEDTWGYIPRFSEMRYKNNMYVGELGFNDGLSQHLGRNQDGLFGESEYNNFTINAAFTNAEAANQFGLRLTDVFRTLPNGGQQQSPNQGIIKCHLFHSIYVNRALPVFSTPSL